MKGILPEKKYFPKHIGLIMDGNGRWAENQGLPRGKGHEKGAEVFEQISKYAEKIGVEYITFYAFSTENWSRPSFEVETLMKLFNYNLIKALRMKDKNEKDGYCLNFIGDIDALPQALKILIRKNQQTKNESTKTVVTIAINYGGRQEILKSVKSISEKIEAGTLKASDVSMQTIQDGLYANSLPDPDLIIRVSGEYRLSNFLLWQSAYSELYFTDVFWPDFKPENLDEAIIEYSRRIRRFGRL